MSIAQVVYNRRHKEIVVEPNPKRSCLVCHSPIYSRMKVCSVCAETPEGKKAIYLLWLARQEVPSKPKKRKHKNKHKKAGPAKIKRKQWTGQYG